MNSDVGKRKRGSGNMNTMGLTFLACNMDRSLDTTELFIQS